jgi:hypothetical protein
MVTRFAIPREVRFVFLGLPALCALAVGCGNNFDPASKVESIRILAERADEPYAKPGDTVVVDLLAADNRKDKSSPMALFWIPSPCVNPFDDAYYNCYPSFESQFERGVDLTPQLIGGPQLSFQVPADTLTQSGSSQSGIPYGSAIVFSMACGGHVQYVGQRGTSPQAVPFACFDANGNELGPDDFVFAYARVFVFADRTNANPTIDGLTLNGQPVDPTAGITLDHCPKPGPSASWDPKCPTVSIDVVVPPSSQELDPSNIDTHGNVRRESLWVDYFLTDGHVKNDVQVIYDPALGRVSPSGDDFEAPGTAGDHTLWAVVHDNRGGVNWIEIPVHAR